MHILGVKSMLKIRGLNTYYGAIHALKDIDIDVNVGEIVSLVGANGAGKSTLVNTVAGTVKAASGTIEFKGEHIEKIEPHKILKRGISLSPEGREVFPALTVEENLRLGAFTVKNKIKIKKQFERCYELFPRLKERVKQQAGTLSGGEQQMLAIGRALMNEPTLLLLDEPSLGLAPNIVLQIFELIQKIAKAGLTIMLIEQNANMALKISDRAYVLENGRISMSGKADVVAHDERIRKVYLGI